MSLTPEDLRKRAEQPENGRISRVECTKLADELERLQRWKTGDWCTLCDAPQWVNHKGEHTCAHNPGLQELTEEMLAELEETRIRRDETVAMCTQLQIENQCDACAGTGKPISGLPCMCRGTGRMSDAAIYLRKELILYKEALEAAEKALAQVHKIPRPWMYSKKDREKSITFDEWDAAGRSMEAALTQVRKVLGKV